MKNWIKGGLIGLGIAIFYTVLSFYDPGCPIDACSTLKKVFLNLIHLIYHQCKFFIQCGGEGCMICLLFLSPLLTVIEFTIIGAIIGWLIEKFKNKQSIKEENN